MTKLTTEITIEELQYRIHAHENDLTQMWTADYFLNVQKELLALKQAAKNPVAWIVHMRTGDQFTTDGDFVGLGESTHGIHSTPLYTAPVLPKQPELIGMKVSIDTGSDNIGHRLFGEIVGTSDSNGVPVLCIEVTENNGDMAAPAQPVSEHKPVGYFSYGSEQSFDWHKTKEEAIEAAEAAIDDYRGDACDGWSEETDSVCWGVILQQATKVDERPRTDDDKCDPAIDTVCDYALIPELVGNSPVIPEGWKLVPIEPTENMIIDGFESEPDKTFSKPEVWEKYAAMSGCKQAAHRAKLCWAAMLSAAPVVRETNND
jgi:hypothetical protein